jgi:hypothetical protein
MANEDWIHSFALDMCRVLNKPQFKNGCRIAVKILPLASILVCSFLPITTLGRQLLILALLIWVQVYFIFDIFFTR